MRATAVSTEKITITAVNKKHQKQVNKAVKCLLAYNALNDLRNLAYDECDDKLTERFDRKCEAAWDKYYDAIYDLPKRELDKIEKSILY
jgi:putative IMPACT (imprinted ancient) family translation regulator